MSLRPAQALVAESSTFSLRTFFESKPTEAVPEGLPTLNAAPMHAPPEPEPAPPSPPSYGPPRPPIGAAAPALALAELTVPWKGEAGGPVEVRLAESEPLALAFDHGEMLGIAMLRLRGKLDYSSVAFALLPERFTLRALQDVHEAILDTRLNKPAFRRRMLDRGWLEPTGERETGASFRPAELYRYRNANQGEQ